MSSLSLTQYYYLKVRRYQKFSVIVLRVSCFFFKFWAIDISQYSVPPVAFSQCCSSWSLSEQLLKIFTVFSVLAFSSEAAWHIRNSIFLYLFRLKKIENSFSLVFLIWHEMSRSNSRSVFPCGTSERIAWRENSYCEKDTVTCLYNRIEQNKMQKNGPKHDFMLPE